MSFFVVNRKIRFSEKPLRPYFSVLSVCKQNFNMSVEAFLDKSFEFFMVSQLHNWKNLLIYVDSVCCKLPLWQCHPQSWDNSALRVCPWAPPSDRQRESGVLSTLLAEEALDFSHFRFCHFHFWSYKWPPRTLFHVIFMRLTHLGCGFTRFECWFSLILKCQKVIFLFSRFPICSNIFAAHFKIKYVKLEFVIIAKIHLEDIENILQNNC